jgi:hypothetical protein
MRDSHKDGMPAVLITAFNRPQQLEQLLNILCQVGISRIYVVIDGPRDEFPSDQALVDDVEKVAKAAQWVSKLDVRKRQRNLGCGLSPANAIAQTLSIEERLIVLEDDCRPTPTFFEYMRQGLAIYSTNEEVAAICGTSYVPLDYFQPSQRVWVSHLFSPWGWGTWRRAWQGFSSKASSWRTRTSLASRFAMGGNSVRGLRWLESNWHWLAKTDPEGRQVWDHLFGLLICERNQVVLRPTVNLVRNVGEDGDGTHATPRSNFLDVSTGVWDGSSVDWPTNLRANSRADRWVLKHDYQARSTLGWLGDLARSVFTPSS